MSLQLENILTPVEVEVTFLHPSSGPVKEIYSLLNPNHLACWRANNKKSGFIQLSIRVTKSTELTESILAQLKEAKIKSNSIYKDIEKP